MHALVGPAQPVAWSLQRTQSPRGGTAPSALPRPGRPLSVTTSQSVETALSSVAAAAAAAAVPGAAAAGAAGAAAARTPPLPRERFLSPSATSSPLLGRPQSAHDGAVSPTAPGSAAADSPPEPRRGEYVPGPANLGRRLSLPAMQYSARKVRACVRRSFLAYTHAGALMGTAVARVRHARPRRPCAPSVVGLPARPPPRAKYVCVP
jgi:hypothetical protein